jgi:hypothetical protein
VDIRSRANTGIAIYIGHGMEEGNRVFMYFLDKPASKHLHVFTNLEVLPTTWLRVSIDAPSHRHD